MKRSLPLIAAFAAILSLTACGGGGGGSGSPQPAPAPAPAPAPVVKTEITTGTGAEATSGKLVKVHYTGWLYSATAAGNKGTMFDSSAGRDPFQFRLGTNAVIPGFEQGVAGMKVGGKRTVIIPAALGYGAAGSPPSIPPNADLVFDVELVEAI